MKKLSSTFRRKSGVSPVDVAATSSVSPIDSNPALSELTNAYHRVLKEQNKQADELRRLQAIKEAKMSEKARAMSFASGTAGNEENVPIRTEIPYFSSGDPPKSPADDAIVSVKGRPAWQKASRKGKGNKKPPLPEKKPNEMTRRMLTAPSFEPSREVLEYDLNRRRQMSFSNDSDYQTSFSQADDLSTSGWGADEVLPQGRTGTGRRWNIPHDVPADEPTLLRALPKGTQNMITQRRDRVEMKPLVSACAYLENEILRMTEQLNSLTSDPMCCCHSQRHLQPICECKHRQFISQSAERLRGVLSILEDRYDSIEQYYVKGKEYARAMGRFYQVSPSEYSRWLEERRPSNPGRDVPALR